MRRWKMAGLLGLLAVVAGTVSVDGQRGRMARAPRNAMVVALQATPDSVRVAVAWGHSTPVSLVRGYVLEVRSPNWSVVDTVGVVTADTVWLPRDTVDVVTATCVRARTDGQDSEESCAAPPFIVPHTVIVSPPGQPTVTPIGGLASMIDSTAILVFTPPNDTLPVGASAKYALVGWTDEGLPGSIMVTCAWNPLTQQTGWAQVDARDDGLYVHQPDGQFAVDEDCAWLTTPAIGSLDPTLLEITRLPTGPYVLGVQPMTFALVGATQLFANGGYGLVVRGHRISDGTAAVGGVVTIEIVSGGWKVYPLGSPPSTASRTCVLDDEGKCTPGDLEPGTEIVIAMALAQTVTLTAQAPDPSGIVVL